MLALITELKQICNYDPVSYSSAKLEVLKEILEEKYQRVKRQLYFHNM